ncbi:IclR family transcriptional regulator domain-containing protein [Halobellus sp. GM3]|uniref:IclR family transcriptional regulator domain-containing protein n=1 Tax=Halobellus sp. GM3 TaxID=3458410 RepID=UPI00403E0942
MTDDFDGRVIQSDEVLFDIIEHLEREGDSGVSELAEAVGRSKGTVHTHLTSLRNRGYVVNDGGKYRLGLRFLDLGIHVQNAVDLYHVAAPKLAEVAAEAEENARCVVEENGLGTFIVGATGKHSVNTDVRVGTQTHLHCISGGKAILAHLPTHRVREIVDAHGLPARTENTITDLDALLTELETIREDGYALNRGESIDGIHAVAAPVLDEDDAVVGAISVSGAANRLPIDRCRGELADLVVATANEVELNLTYADSR